MPYKKSPMKKSSCIKMYDKKGKPSGLMMEGSAMQMEAGSPAKQIDERSGEGVTVTGDASKVGVYGAQLGKVYKAIEDTISSGGYMGSQQQSEAGLGYGTNPSEELSRLKQMEQEKGAPETFRYIRRRARNTVGSEGQVPEYLNMPNQIKT